MTQESMPVKEIRNQDKRETRWNSADGRALYRDLFEEAPDSMFIADPQGRLISVHARIIDLTGYSAEELLGMNIIDLVPAEDPVRDPIAKKELDRGKVITKERCMIRKDGDILWVENRMRRLPGGDILGMMIDITDRRQAGEALKASEARFDLTAELSRTCVWEVDETGLYTYVSRAVEQVLGYLPEELVGRMRFYDLRPDDEREAFTAAAFELFERKGCLKNLESRVRTKDGRLIWVSVYGAPLFRENRTVRGYRGCTIDITELKAAEERLAHSHDLLRYIIEHAQSAVAVHDRNLKYIYVSRRYLEEYGVREQDVIGKHHYEVFPDLPQKWRDVHQKALAGEVCRGDRDPYYRQDGSMDWTRWECRPWYEKGGPIGGIIIYTEVITERVQAEEAIRESETNFRRLFETMAQGVIYLGPDGQIILANPSAERILGLDFSAAAGRTLRIRDWKPIREDGSELPDYEHPALVALNTGKQVDSFVMGVTNQKTGDRVWLSVSAIPLSRPGESRPFQVHTSFRDITGRKRVERELIESHRMLKDVIETIPARVFWKDCEGRYLGCNRLFARDAGRDSPESLIGDHDFNLAWTEEAEMYRADDRSVIESGEAKINYEEQQTKADGQKVWLRTSKIPLRDGEGRIYGVLGSCEDITEHKFQQEAREKLETQLRQAQKMESVGRLAGGVAHDFNNMLGVIVGHTEMALAQVDTTSPVFTHLQEIHQAAERSADLTRQLLAFARKQTVTPKVLDLNENVEGMLNMMRRLIGEDIDLAWRPGTHLGSVKMDPSQIEQLLANLCVNARDALRDTGTVTVETRLAAIDEAYCAGHAGFIPGEYVMLAVSDNGCGMGPEVLSHLFEPFFTTKEVGKGTGLGLATVYGIVKQNNGFINVYTEPGYGSTFKIYLPRCTAEPEFMRKEQVEPRPALGHETVLLVEDEPAILDIVQLMLEAQGYRVLAAGTPDEAIRMAWEHGDSINLLITDVVMPRMNGRELARSLMSICPDIKCLFMSGYTANAIAHHGVLDKDAHFIQKPFTVDDLAAKVRHVIEETRETGSSVSLKTPLF